MKKIVKYFMMVIALCIFALTANSFSMAEASALYTPASYWNNDTNYPLAFSQNGLTYSPCLNAGDSWIQTILAY